MTEPIPLQLTAAEARLLGCLIEKESTTPEQYPLTEHAAQLAANQKTSRDPVLALDAGTVAHALRGLETKGLARRVDGARSLRFEHTAARALELPRGQLVALALLLLRGPQTAGELLARAERMHRYTDSDDLDYAIERLAGRGWVIALPRAPGQREGRWAQLLWEHPGHSSGQDESGVHDDKSLLTRIIRLEARVTALEAQLDHRNRT